MTRLLGKCLVSALLFAVFPLPTESSEVYDASTGYVTQIADSSKNMMAMDPKLWSDGAVPHSGTNYYVAAGNLLYCDYSSVTNFAGDELVLGGFIRQLASGWGHKISFPHVVMLPGSYLLYSNTGRIEADCTVEGTAANPARCWQGDADGKDRSLYQDIKWKGSENAYLVFQRKLYGSSNVAKQVGGFKGELVDAWSGYAGTAIFTGPLLTYRHSAQLNSPSTFVVTNGASLYLDGDDISLRRLAVHDEAKAEFVRQGKVTIGDILIRGGGIMKVAISDFTVTNSLCVENGSKISISSNPIGGWKSGDPDAPVSLMTFWKNVARPVSYADVFDIPSPDNAVGGIPSLVYSETENEEGHVTVSVGYREVVTFTKSGSADRTLFNPVNPDYSLVSDTSPVSPEKDYINNACKMYVSGGDYGFVGHSLTINGGRLSIYSGKKFTCENLYLVGGWIGPQKANGSAYFDGNIHVQGGSIRIGGDGKVTGIHSDLHGTVDIPVIRADVDGDDVSKVCWMELKGDNTGFSGRIVFGDHSGSNANLRIWNKSNLGGEREGFTEDALSVADSCALYIMPDEGGRASGPEVFDDLTRGWLFEGENKISAGKDVSVYNRITVGKVLRKIGTGTLAVADVAGEEIVVDEGAVRFLSTDALVNLSALSFGAGAEVVVDAAADAGLVSYGVDLSSTRVTAPEGGITVRFLNVEPEGVVGIAVATLSSEADAAAFRFVRPAHCRVQKRVVPLGDGKFLLKAEISKNAMKVIVR